MTFRSLLRLFDVKHRFSRQYREPNTNFTLARPMNSALWSLTTVSGISSLSLQKARGGEWNRCYLRRSCNSSALVSPYGREKKKPTLFINSVRLQPAQTRPKVEASFFVFVFVSSLWRSAAKGRWCGAVQRFARDFTSLHRADGLLYTDIHRSTGPARPRSER